MLQQEVIFAFSIKVWLEDMPSFWKEYGVGMYQISGWIQYLVAIIQ